VPRASNAAHDRLIASVNRPEAARPRSLGDFGLGDHPAVLANRVSAVAGMAVVFNSVTSRGRSTAPIPTTRRSWPRRGWTRPRPTATRGRRAGRDCCFDDESSRRHEVRRPTRHASGGTRERRASRQRPCFDEQPTRVGSCGHDRPGRRVHARRLARRSRRWAIRWAKPGRIGPYRAHHHSPASLPDIAYLQVLSGSTPPRTPCFTRERSQVRHPPRPSETC
jgi:hypothetical protein